MAFIGYTTTVPDADVANATMVVTVPTGVTDNDQLIMILTADADSIPVTITGWVQRGSLGAGAPSNIVTRVWTRTASSEPASYTVTWVTNASLTDVGTMIAYKNSVINIYAQRTFSHTQNPAAGTAIHDDADLAAGSTTLFSKRIIYYVGMSGAWLKGALTITPPAGLDNDVPKFTQASSGVPTQISGFYAVYSQRVTGAVAPAVAFDIDTTDCTFHPASRGVLIALETLSEGESGGDSWGGSG